MKRPWQVWSAFAVTLAAVLVGMAWLTVKVDRLDRAEARAQWERKAMSIRADFEGDVRLALRRMDLAWTELFDRESSWRHFTYRSFLVPPGDAKVKPVPSPLLNPRSEHVQLYFQIDSSGNFSSPGVPPEAWRKQAVEHDLPEETIDNNKLQLYKLKQLVTPEKLSARLPEQSVEESQALANAALQLNVRADPPVASDNRAPGRTAAQTRGQTSPQLDQQAIQARNSADFQSRAKRLNSYTNISKAQQVVQSAQNQLLWSYGQKGGGKLDPRITNALQAVEGNSLPIWLGSELVVARQTLVGGKTFIEGCWLDWSKVKAHLTEEVRDLRLGQVDLVPVTENSEEDLSRMLAMLPARLIVAGPGVLAFNRPDFTPMRWALLVGWACLLLAVAAVAMLLAGVVSLSERRAAFVSAVTHELRTPLTTFRMYAEMLAADMVPEAEKKKLYLGTLKREADRLVHLVENVLAYARLERRGRGTQGMQQTTLGHLIESIRPRLEERAATEQMELVVEAEQELLASAIRTDDAAVEQILLNLFDNACKYAATAEDRRIHLAISAKGNRATFRVRDHGPGISADARGRLFVPFGKSASQAAHSAPGVGLGLSLCRRLAKQLGGRLQLDPDPPTEGACFLLTLPLGA